jgi:hypothetical protein
MQFNYQRIGIGVKADDLADTIINYFQPLQFGGPGALMDALREWSQSNKLGLRVSQFSGVINVHGDRGIILRIRPND